MHFSLNSFFNLYFILKLNYFFTNAQSYGYVDKENVEKILFGV